MRILLVEDDTRLSASLVQILEDGGYEVDAVANGSDGLAFASSSRYDVVVLDWMLPKMDGAEVARELRRQGVATPIIMLTARSATGDKVEGLDSGVDDYMTKPFAPAELLARLRALSRRQGEVQFEVLAAGDLSLGLESHDLSCGAESIHLRMKEFLILKMLMANLGRVVPRDTMIDRVWGVDSDTTSNSVEAHISFIRKKLKFLGSMAAIEAVPKVGYRLDVQPAGSSGAAASEDDGAPGCEAPAADEGAGAAISSESVRNADSDGGAR